MKRLGLLLAVLALAGTALTTAVAGTHAAKKALCHRTSSAKNPYVKVSLSTKTLAGYLKKHPADIYPVPSGGCPKSLLATTGGKAFDVTLVGESESPAGDPVGNGTATIRLRLGQAQACYKLAAKNLPAAVAAHIHSGAAGSSGPVVIPLATPGSDGTSSGCATTTRALVAQILANPGNFYVNVHTAEFPAGAIRGQLTGTSADSVGTIYSITLNGSTEPNATGTAVVRIIKSSNLVCYRLHAANVTLPTVAAHIHRGAANTNGPVVVPFTPPAADGNSSGCATSTADLVNEITGNPAGFYVNVHTKEHPAGAMRNQLG
jgi:CHRD domain